MKYPFKQEHQNASAHLYLKSCILLETWRYEYEYCTLSPNVYYAIAMHSCVLQSFNCLHQLKAEGEYVFAPVRASVRACVCPSVLRVCYQLISGAVGPDTAKMSTHTPWMPIQNLCPTFFKWPCSSATTRPMFAKHISVHYSYRFCPQIMQIGQYLLVLIPNQSYHL